MSYAVCFFFHTLKPTSGKHLLVCWPSKFSQFTKIIFKYITDHFFYICLILSDKLHLKPTHIVTQNLDCFLSILSMIYFLRTWQGV